MKCQLVDLIRNKGLDTMWKEAILPKSEELSLDFPGGIIGSNENILLGQVSTLSRFESWASCTRDRNAVDSIMTFP